VNMTDGQGKAFGAHGREFTRSQATGLPWGEL
jgi:hypothetical protein